MNDQVVDPLPYDATLDELIDRLRDRHRFGAVGVPWTGGVDAGLARFYGNVYLLVVLRAHSPSTVHRMETVADRNAPSHLLHAAQELFSGSRTDAAAFLVGLVERHAAQDTVPYRQVD